MMANYRDARNWLFSLEKLGIKFGLQNMRSICRLVGRPERAFPSIHIAGTNGKGSTASFIVSMAEAADLKCGLTTSPHLSDVRERIRIGRERISRRDFTRLVKRLVEELEARNARKKGKAIVPTFFEAVIALAFMYFAEMGIDLAVVEAGLGGRLDSTNVIVPELVIITNIGIEHSRYLGNTLRSIAKEKAGIIKPGAPVLSAASQPEVVRVLEDAAGRQRAALRLFGRDFKMERTGRTIRYSDERRSLDRLKPKLPGKHQEANAALAVRAAFELRDSGFPLTDKHIRRGLANAHWPGRLEYFEHDPPWLVDCAHNPAATGALAAHLRDRHPGSKILAVFAAMKDKEYGTMMETLSSAVTDWIFTRPSYERAEAPARLADACESRGKKYRRSRLSEGLALAASMEGSYDLVLVSGSIFLVGPAYRFIERHAGRI